MTEGIIYIVVLAIVCNLILIHNFFQKRNMEVRNYLISICNDCYVLVYKDINNKNPYKWRIKELEKLIPLQNQMVNKFWRPYDSFIQNWDFLKEF